ncbi:Gustatory receptor 117b [Halyomorpha halys]|nr:Gustatory receptor 117b [Halyomorpha halys]
MVTIVLSQPTIGKVELGLNDLFKVPRMIGTFPIDSNYSGISKFNLTKGIVFNLLTTTISIMWFNSLSWRTEISFVEKLGNVLHILNPVFFNWIHLSWSVRNRYLIKEIYNELREIEYQLSKSGVCLFYNPTWFTKYLSLAVMLSCEFLWELITKKLKTPQDNLVYIAAYTPFLSVMSQYVALIEVLLSILRGIRSIEESVSVVKLTDKLLALCQKVNTLYELQLFLYIDILFVMILILTYVPIHDWSSFSPILGIWAMSFFFPLFQMILYVGMFCKEVKKINKTLYKRLLLNLDDETLEFHLMVKREIVFTAGGFFDLGNTLIWSMFTTVVNYLVFLVQYT